MSLNWFYNRMEFNWGVGPMQYGPEWRLCRKLLHEQFNRHEVAHYAAQQEGSTRVMLRDLLSAPGDFCTHVQQLVLHRQFRCQYSDDTSSRWAARIVVDIGYGIDIGDNSTYVTLAKGVSTSFSLGLEPARWLVDSLPPRA